MFLLGHDKAVRFCFADCLTTSQCCLISTSSWVDLGMEERVLHVLSHVWKQRWAKSKSYKFKVKLRSVYLLWFDMKIMNNWLKVYLVLDLDLELDLKQTFIFQITGIITTEKYWKNPYSTFYIGLDKTITITESRFPKLDVAKLFADLGGTLGLWLGLGVIQMISFLLHFFTLFQKQ